MLLDSKTAATNEAARAIGGTTARAGLFSGNLQPALAVFTLQR
jgi:hypothetical protein